MSIVMTILKILILKLLIMSDLKADRRKNDVKISKQIASIQMVGLVPVRR